MHQDPSRVLLYVEWGILCQTAFFKVADIMDTFGEGHNHPRVQCVLRTRKENRALAPFRLDASNKFCFVTAMKNGLCQTSSASASSGAGQDDNGKDSEPDRYKVQDGTASQAWPSHQSATPFLWDDAATPRPARVWFHRFEKAAGGGEKPVTAGEVGA
jgi:hypothetical protein